MNTSQTTEYAVHLLRHAVNGTKRWQAFVETSPRITAEGESCKAVLEEIGLKLLEALAEVEGAVDPAESAAHQSLPRELAELEAQVQAQGHKFYGVFADDPGALEVFDEIERLRDQHTLGDPSSPSPS